MNKNTASVLFEEKEIEQHKKTANDRKKYSCVANSEMVISYDEPAPSISQIMVSEKTP